MKPADLALKKLDRLVGAWTSEATHPKMPGVVVKGTATFEWLEGERFLIQRGRNEHPDFPDGMWIIGYTDQDRAGEQAHGPMTAHYFDERGVSRIFQFGVDDNAFHWWRDAPGFSQRFTGTFEDGGNTIVGLSQLREDDVHWHDDLAITYRRR